MTDTYQSSGSVSSTLPVGVKEASAPDASTPIPTSIEEHKPERDESSEYISGIRLYTVLLSVTLVMFLIMLDQTIVVTVN